MPTQSSYATFDEGSRVRRIREVIENPEGVLKGLGAIHMSLSREAFRHGGVGERWKDRMNPNWPGIVMDFHKGRAQPAPHRFRTGPGLTLIDTGRGRNSVAFRLVGRHVVEIGTNLDYMDALHAGRPTKSEPITDRFQDWFSDWLYGPGSSYIADLQWLLDPVLKGQRIEITHPERPIVGFADDLKERAEALLGIEVNVEFDS